MRRLLLVWLASWFSASVHAGQPTEGAQKPLPPGAVVVTSPLTTREGGTLSALAFSADGKWLASGGPDQALCLWDVDTGKRRQFDDQMLQSLVFLPDRKTLVHGWGPILTFVALAGGEEPRQVQHQGSTTCLACSPDGKLLASVGDDRSIRLFDVASGREVRQLKGHQGYTSAVAFSPDGKMLASGSLDQTLRLWEVETGKALHECLGHEDLIAGIAFAPDGKTIASASWDGTIRLWEATTGKAAGILRGHVHEVVAIAFAPDGRTLLSASLDGTVRIWDSVTGKEGRRLQVHTQGILAMAVSSDGKIIATGDASNAIHLWDANTGKRLRTLRSGLEGVADKTIHCVDLSPGGGSFVTGGGDGAVRLWDVASGKEVRLLGKHPEIVWGVAFSPDGKTVASVARRHGVTRLWDVATGKKARAFKGPMGGTSRVLFSRDGKRLCAAGGSFDPTLFLWEVATGRELQRFAGHSDYIDGAALSPDDKMLASASRDGSLRIWDTGTGREMRQLREFPQGIAAAVFSPDGKALITGSSEGCRLWDVATGKPGRLLGSQGKSGRQLVTLARTGKTLACVNEDGSIQLLELTTGLERRRFTGAANPWWLAFSWDGRRLASAGRDGIVIVWDVTALGLKTPHAPDDFSDQQLKALWRDLATQDAQRAHDALWKLTCAPEKFPAFFKAHLRPVPVVPDQRLAQFIGNLGDERYPVREKARQELERLGEQAREALHAAQKKSSSLEVLRRVDLLLSKLDGAGQPADRLQALRAVEVLEHIGNLPARQLLAEVSKSPVDFRVKAEAKDALQRLTRNSQQE